MRALPPGRLFGDRLHEARVGGFTLSERRYPGGFATPSHAHARPLLCYVVDGGYTETLPGRTRECAPATLLLHPAGERHGERYHARGGRSLIVECDAGAIPDSQPGLDSGAHPRGPRLATLGARLYREFVAPEPDSPAVIETLLTALLGEAARTSAPSRAVPPWLPRVRELLRERFSEKLTLDALAAEAGVHPVHLAQSFTRWRGCTIGEYLRARRVAHARERLLHGDEPPAQIALAAGFADQSHLTRVFRRATGMTPVRYRAAYRR